jgi:hypothetical protein
MADSDTKSYLQNPTKRAPAADKSQSSKSESPDRFRDATPYEYKVMDYPKPDTSINKMMDPFK